MYYKDMYLTMILQGVSRAKSHTTLVRIVTWVSKAALSRQVYGLWTDVSKYARLKMLGIWYLVQIKSDARKLLLAHDKSCEWWFYTSSARVGLWPTLQEFATRILNSHIYNSFIDWQNRFLSINSASVGVPEWLTGMTRTIYLLDIICFRARRVSIIHQHYSLFN